MNLRTLKKLSKLAAPLLKALGDDREQFLSGRGDNYHCCVIKDRKHWVRVNCHLSRNEGWDRDGCFVFTTRSGRRKLMRPPPHPRKGTVMVGSVSGGYQPEWDEECAWVALSNLVHGHFTDWSGETPIATRQLRFPRDFLQGARDILKEIQIGKR